MLEIRRYLTSSQDDVFGQWLMDLRDTTARAKINARILRLAHGNLGDCKPLGAGVWELRIHWGPGYRVYYGMIGREVVLLLCGGDKRKQATDIARAISYFQDYKQRTGIK